MSNTLGIEEATMAQLADSTHAVNTVRTSVDEWKTVRATNHVADQGGTDDPDLFALFTSKGKGMPWVKTPELTRLTWDKSMGLPAACPTNVTYVVPNYDYSEFQ